MPLLTAIRDAACAHLMDALPQANRIEAFPAMLDLDRLAPRSVQFAGAASLFLAIGECRNVGALALDCEAEFWAFAVARQAARPTVAVDAALSLAQGAILALHGQTFGIPGISPACVRSLRPITDEGLEKAGIHAWEILWSMRVTLREES